MDVRQKLDRYDVALSISSGALTSLIDVIWIKDISLADAHEWGSAKVDEFVLKVAKHFGYQGNDISGAIKKLEDDYPMDGDLLTNEFGGGYSHHLRDFSHHPTPVGLMFSLLMQFTGKGYGTKTNGDFVTYDIPGWKPKKFAESIYMGTVVWLVHIVSDIAGSSGTRRDGREGTGLPGPMLSMLKELSALPGIRDLAQKTDSNSSPNKEANNQFSVVCSKLFNGTLLGEHDENGKIVPNKQLRFDLRTELGMVHESIQNKQYFPVMLNELIVASFYSVRRFMIQVQEEGIKNIEDLERMDISKCLPWKNEAIIHMRMIANATFTSIDLSAAGIKAALKHKDDPSGFALDFMQGINYWGLGSLALSSNSEFMNGIKKMHNGFLAAAEKTKQKIIEKLPNGQADWETGKYAAETTGAVIKIGTPIGFISAAIGVYDEINKSLKDLKIATEERIRIEQECTDRIEVIRANRKEMEEMVSDYLNDKMIVFTQAFSKMDKAVTENDVEAYILGNSMIQNKISGKSMFNSMDEFEDLMIKEETLKF